MSYLDQPFTTSVIQHLFQSVAESFNWDLQAFSISLNIFSIENSQK